MSVRTGDDYVDWKIANLLGRFGSQAKYAVPFLIKGYNMGIMELRECAEVLQKITGVSSDWETWLKNQEE